MGHLTFHTALVLVCLPTIFSFLLIPSLAPAAFEATKLAGPSVESSSPTWLGFSIAPACRRSRRETSLRGVRISAMGISLPGTEKEEDARGIVVYSTPGCKYCARAKARLQELGAPYKDIDVGSDSALRAAVKEKVGGKTSVPQIFIAGEHVGGCDELLGEESSGQLAARLDAAGILLSVPSAEQLSIEEECVAIDVEPEGGVLNFHGLTSVRGEGGVHVDELARQLQRRVLNMYDEFLTADGRAVDFVRMKGSKAFAEYVLQTACLRDAAVTDQLLNMGSAERQALFINIYNSLILHATIALDGRGPSSPEHRGPFFSGESGARYNIGGTAFSLDDIEHGILRGSPEGDKRSFAAGDARLRLAAKEADPRLHFVLNCGAKSCPPIKLYSAENLEEGLNAAAQAFCDEEVSVDVSNKLVRVSRIFLWYGCDFGDGEAAVLRRVCEFMKEGSDAQRNLDALLKGGDFKVVYNDYDWATNSV